MGKTVQHPRYNVVSFRASDEEMDKLRELGQCLKLTSTSDILRSAFHTEHARQITARKPS